MDIPEPEVEVEREVGRGRTRRAAAIIGVALLALCATAVAYLHPAFRPAQPNRAGAVVAPPGSYSLAAVDFVDPTTGWVVVDFDDGDFQVMRTEDAGRSWTRELSGPSGGQSVFLKFFDGVTGYFALTGPRPILYRTSDGGITWSADPALNPAAYALSWSFPDAAHGWLLVQGPKSNRLYRTADAGSSWLDLGVPVPAPDQAFRVSFASAASGWIDSLSGGPYLYHSTDLGRTWTRLRLPAPAAGWPRAGQYLVAAQPTVKTGVVASVVNFAPPSGRSAAGGTILVYPPLTVRTFDGGSPVTYTYGTSIDSMAGAGLAAPGSVASVQVPDEVELGSLDGGLTWSRLALPSAGGAIGYADPLDWWWLGPGSWARSSDGGVTWTPPRNIGVPQALPGSLQVLDANHAWFAAVAGSRSLLETTADGGVHWDMAILPEMSGRVTP